MSIPRLFATLLLVGISSLSLVARAAGPATGDVEFLMRAAQAGRLEVEAGTLAEKIARAPKVKQFAQQMISDHSKANAELDRVAQAKGVALPTVLISHERKRLESLRQLTGSSFDKKYLQEIGVRAHEQAVELYESASVTTTDKDIKAFVTDNLPRLKQHLEAARGIEIQP